MNQYDTAEFSYFYCCVCCGTLRVSESFDGLYSTFQEKSISPGRTVRPHLHKHSSARSNGGVLLHIIPCCSLRLIIPFDRQCCHSNRTNLLRVCIVSLSGTNQTQIQPSVSRTLIFSPRRCSSNPDGCIHTIFDTKNASRPRDDLLRRHASNACFVFFCWCYETTYN